MNVPERHAFQYTPMGIIAVGDPIPTMPTAVDAPAPGAVVHNTRVQVEDYRAPVGMAPGPRAAALPSVETPITGKQLIGMARKRLRELDKTVPQLERERVELRRLVDAAAGTTRRTKREPKEVPSLSLFERAPETNPGH